MVGLRALATTPGLVERDALDRTLGKLEAAAGDLGRAPRAGSQVDIDDGAQAPALGRRPAAVAGGRRRAPGYFVPDP